MDDSWVPYKLDIEVGMPDHLDLSKLTGSGLQPGEEILPDDDIPKKEVNFFSNQENRAEGNIRPKYGL